MNSQNGFAFYGANKNRQQVTFKFINNLIVIPLKINGKELSFILDTGVNKTILFNLSKNDSLGLKNIEKVALQGLGDGKPVEALLSKNNVLTL
ncbi:MAG: retropepsin-like aspartic protease, partial [Polaribacter sp.]